MYINETANPAHKSKKVKHFAHAMNSIAHSGRLNKWRFNRGNVRLKALNFFLATESGIYALMTGTNTIHHTITVIEHPTSAGYRTISAKSTNCWKDYNRLIRNVSHIIHLSYWLIYTHSHTCYRLKEWRETVIQSANKRSQKTNSG